MNQPKDTTQLMTYVKPEFLSIDYVGFFPAVGFSEGEIEGANTGLEKDMELDGDFGD